MARTLHLELDPRLGRRAAIEHALRSAIVDGRLHRGDLLPSSRALAADLGVSRATVVAAFEQLLVEGFIAAEQGRATRVAYDGCTTEPTDPDRSYGGSAFAHDLRPGQPDVSAFPRRAWLRSIRRVLDGATDAAFGYPDPRGMGELRAALSAYLARARSVVAEPAAVHIVAGFGTGISFVAELFARRGERRIAVEDPMLFVHRHLLAAAGLEPVPIPVDGDGMRVDLLDAADVDAVLVCPAHQYPLGGTLSAERRGALVTWARGGRWIVEDDFDGEYRYDRRPVGALHGLAPDRVVYAGTASKTLAPGLRLGWLIAPAPLRDELLWTIHGRGGVSTIEQLAFADLLDSGAFDRHIRTMRPRYRARRDAVSEALDAIDWLTVPRHAAGLHVTARIDGLGRDEGEIEARLGERSVGVLGLRRHYLGEPAERGLVLGFANPPEHRFAATLGALVAALANC